MKTHSNETICPQCGADAVETTTSSMGVTSIDGICYEGHTWTSLHEEGLFPRLRAWWREVTTPMWYRCNWCRGKGRATNTWKDCTCTRDCGSEWGTVKFYKGRFWHPYTCPKYLEG